VDHTRGYAEIEHTGELDLATLQRAVADDGYAVSPWSGAAALKRHSARDVAEIAGAFAVLIGIIFALQYFDLLPHGLAVSDSMSYGLVVLIGLVASVSSCMAVTGGLLVAAAATYNTSHASLSGFERVKPHLYFNVGRIVSYTLLGGVIGAIGSALTLSAEATGVLTIVASVIMIAIGLKMLGLLPGFGRLLPDLPRAVSDRIHGLATRQAKGGAFALGAATFFLPCGFTQALQLYVLGKGDIATGALTMLAFSLGTLPALVSLSALSSFAKGALQRRFLRMAGAAVIVLGVLNIEHGLVLSGLGANASLTEGEAEAATRPTMVNGRQVVVMKVVDFGYIPHVFEVKQNVPVEWRIDASEAAGCGQLLLAPRLGIRRLLSSVSTTTITFMPREPGEFPFNCGMGMMTPGSKFVVVPNSAG
jgi:sulfite exporter TauE/SafE